MEAKILRKIGGLLRAKYDHTAKSRSRTFLRMSSDPDAHGEERDLDGLTPVVLEARFEGTVLLDSWYVKLFEQALFSSRSTRPK